MLQVLPLCLLHRGWEMFQILLTTAWGFLSQAVELHLVILEGSVLLFVSQRGTVLMPPVDSRSACVGICMCPCLIFLTHPLLQVLPEPHVLGSWASRSPRKAVDWWSLPKRSPGAHCHVQGSDHTTILELSAEKIRESREKTVEKTPIGLKCISYLN